MATESKVPPRGGRGKKPRPTKSAAPTRAAAPAGNANRRPGQSGGARGRQAAFQARKRRNRNVGFGVVGLVLVAIVVLIVVALTNGGSSGTIAGRKPAPAQAINQLSGISVAKLSEAANNFKLDSYPSALPASTPALTSDGKPELLYLGAEYCPYCAAQRWAMVTALLKFGTFTGLKEIKSSPTDVNPNTPTFSFYKSTYTSQYLVFTSVETETVAQKPLETPTKAQTALELANDSSGGIPFLYYGGKYASNGSYYNAPDEGDVLAGLSVSQAAAKVVKGGSAASSNVDAASGVMISLICQMTGGQPGAVCDSFPKAITG